MVFAFVFFGAAVKAAELGTDPSQNFDAAGKNVDSPPVGTADDHAPAGRRIEEIIVTAQKKEQTLHDVPISLSVINDEFMKDQSITDFRELSLYVPSTSVNPSSGQYNDVRIRGFGSPFANTKAFEQSVGLVIDGVPYTRIPYWQAGLFDLERVEVLRGPQGTLFGKNTTAGLFNVVTKQPSDEYTGYIDGGLGELDARRFEAAIGGPLIAKFVNFRLSGLSDERGGYMDNTTARIRPGVPERMNSLDRKALRAQLGLPDLYGASFVVRYEAAASDTNGTGWNLRRVVPNQIPFFRYWDPNVNLKPDTWIGSTDGADFTKARIHTLTANGSYDLAGWALNLVAGHSVLNWKVHLDEDFTPAPYFSVPIDKDENPQTVVELRANSPSLPGFLGIDRLMGVGLGRSDFVAGFFFDHREVANAFQDANLNAAIYAQFLATDATGVVPPCNGCESLAEEARIAYEQSSKSFAGFGQLNWYPAEHWTLEYGMRFTDESKVGDWVGSCVTITCVAFAAALNAKDFTHHERRSESAFTPKATLRYDWTDDVNFYVGWGKGFKAGGFNGTVYNDNLPFDFQPEKATSWELGTKMGLFDRVASLNLGLYRETVTNLQVFVVTAGNNLRVVNAGNSRSQGVEADLMWLPTSWLTLRGAMAFDDTKYIEFPNGTCPADKPGPGPPPFGGPCDLSGRPFEFTPRWTGTLTPSMRFPLNAVPGVGALVPLAAPAIDMIGGLSIEYKDNYYANATLDPRTRQPSFIRLGGTLGFGNLNQGWSLRVVAENLTDEVVAEHVQDVSLVGKSFVQTLDPPRLIHGEFRWQF